MTQEQKIKCHSIIHTAAGAASLVGSGLAQIPGSDSVVIISIQVTMVIGLGAVFGITIDKSTAKATLATMTATLAGRTISQFLVGWIPVVGNAINATTAGAMTETVGWAIANDFHNNKPRKKQQKDK